VVITEPKALSYAEMAGMIDAGIVKRIRYESISDSEAETLVRKS